MARTAFLRSSPRFAGVVKDLVGAIRGKVVSQRGFTVPAVGVSLGNDFLAIHDPTLIEPFTEHTGGMAHISLLATGVRPSGERR